MTLKFDLVRRKQILSDLSSHLEQTIASPVEFSGIGLHSGAPVQMRLLPAPAGSGIVFRRTDLDNFEIPANSRNVAKVSYATSLMRQSVLISTTEHLLSALIGMGIDNVIVELDNLELPILDGSALPYIEAFAQVGVKTQRRKREYLRILKTVEVREGGKFIGVYPGEGYSVSYHIDFPPPIGKLTRTSSGSAPASPFSPPMPWIAPTASGFSVTFATPPTGCKRREPPSTPSILAACRL